MSRSAPRPVSCAPCHVMLTNPSIWSCNPPYRFLRFMKSAPPSKIAIECGSSTLRFLHCGHKGLFGCAVCRPLRIGNFIRNLLLPLLTHFPMLTEKSSVCDAAGSTRGHWNAYVDDGVVGELGELARVVQIIVFAEGE